MPKLIVAKRGEEGGLTRKACELNGGDCPSSGRLASHLLGLRDLARLGDALDVKELDPLDMADDAEAHRFLISHRGTAVR